MNLLIKILAFVFGGIFILCIIVVALKTQIEAFRDLFSPLNLILLGGISIFAVYSFLSKK